MSSVSKQHLRVVQSSLESATALNVFDQRSALSDVTRPGRSWTQLLAVPILLALLGIAAMSIDMQVADWARDERYPNDVKKLFDLAEVFGHGFGVAFILFAAWLLAPEKRPRLPRLIVATCAAGIIGTLVKMFVARQRPNRVEFFDIGVTETFGQWFPFFSNSSGWQSFPSGHSAMAVGLSVSLTSLFPRGKWLFAALAAMVMLQRIASGYHFISDTLWGAAIGWLVASAFLMDGWLSRPFNRLEQRLASSS